MPKIRTRRLNLNRINSLYESDVESDVETSDCIRCRILESSKNKLEQQLMDKEKNINNLRILHDNLKNELEILKSEMESLDKSEKDITTMIFSNDLKLMDELKNKKKNDKINFEKLIMII